ncbi:CwfJ C-terminus 1-domain-containing protein-like protein [Xylariales sp. AK1849]|nr:CwfJ C-terminus 1-domain-containing protein-like protein [Xylariales sp. AK1849]
MAAKVVVLGSLNGKLESAFQKLTTLHAKNSFSLAIITGNLFGDGEDESTVLRLLNGEIRVPLSTYFTVGTSPLPPQVVERIEKDEDICENLHYLGKRSINTTSDGIRIVTLGGALDRAIVAGQSKEQHLPFHTVGDATSLRGANKADILLTSTWPAGVWSNSKVVLAPENQAAVASSQEVAELCTAIKPRYHLSFSPAEFFYEREPFFYPVAQEDSDNKPVTRFISLAPFANSTKAKAMYAFSIQAGETTSTIPDGSSMSPFFVRKRAADTNSVGYPGRFANNDGHSDGPSRRRARRRSPPPGPSQCFFCLSNADLATHMVCSIGDHAYVAAAKGPLPASDSYTTSGLSFSCHQIIVPLAHEPSMRAIPEERLQTYKEMERFREAMQAMVAAQSNHGLGTVTWEISRANNIHLHWQFLPIPIDFLRKGLVEAAFKVEAENLRYPALREQSIDSGIDEDGAFLRLWLWSDDSDAEIKGKEIVMPINDSFRFDLQFPRKVLAKLLQLEGRIRWQDVTQSIGDETTDANKFKEAFKPFDFTLA